MNKHIRNILVTVSCIYAISSTGYIFKIQRENQILKQDLQVNKTKLETYQKDIEDLRTDVYLKDKRINELNDIALKYAIEQEKKNKLIDIVLDNRPTLERSIAEDIATAINMYSERFKIPVEELLAIIKVESNFNPNELGTNDDSGLMQLIPSTQKDIAKSMGIKEYNVFNVYTNIEMGAYYIHELKEKYGKFAYIVYNQGLTKPLNDETYVTNLNSSTSYISRILKYTTEFKEEINKCQD